MVVACFALVPSVYNAHGAVRRQLLNESIVQTLRIILVLVAAPHGLLAVAWAQVVASILNGVLLYRMIRPDFVIRLRDWLQALKKSMAVTVITATAMTAAFIVLSKFDPSPFATLVVSAIVGGGSWLLGVRLTRHVIGPEIIVWLSAAARKIRRR
jgi:hypothetical protein